MKPSRGFSLLELLIVVAIILIITTIAVPSFLRSRQAANESAAVAGLRLITVAQNAYAASQQQIFAGSVAALIADGMLDERFTGQTAGYDFDVELQDQGRSFLATATAGSSTTGRFDYYSGLDFVIRFTTTAGRAPDGMAGQPVE
jgi:prepilin-type N-terminal cleavage/methylation domain-containing protein